MSFARRPTGLGSCLSVGIALTILASSVGCRDSAARDVDLSKPIDADPKLRVDSLANGLRYYLRPNGLSEDYTELRLVVNAGSVLEDEDQRGLAHAVEHMAIRGSRRFPRRAVEQYFASLGMRRGDGVNGTTSSDETKYRLTLPSDRIGAIDTALAMLAGIAQDATFDADEARVESGILLEEWRSGRDADQRRRDFERGLLLEGSPYASRPPIGDTTILRRFDIEPLRRFYRTWYRPELMAVIAVGPFDVDTMEAMVRRHFGAIPAGSRSPARPSPQLPSRGRPPRTAVHVDAEATGTRVAIGFPGPEPRMRLVQDFRDGMVRTLWRAILQLRLDAATLRPSAPLISVDVDVQTEVRGLRRDVVSALVARGEARTALREVASHVHELGRHAVMKEELEVSGRAYMQRALWGHETGDNSFDLAAEFEDHFLTGDAPIARSAWYRTASNLMPTITPDDLLRFGRSFAFDSGAIISLSGAPGDPDLSVNEADLARDARNASGTRPPAMRVAVLSDDRLLRDTPKAGNITSEQRIEEVSAFDWRLGNGVRVLLKPTSFAYDEIEFRAIFPGGSSLASPDDYASAYLSDAIVRSMGVGTMPAERLSRWLEQTSVALQPNVGDEAISFSGSSNEADLEHLFEVFHAYVTAPRSDTVAFQRYRERMLQLRRERARDPEEAFLDTLTALTDGTAARMRQSGAAFLGEARPDVALRFWNERVVNAAGLTVVLTGDFTLERVRPLIARYLASLPAGRREHPRDVGLRFPAGITRRELASGVAGRARTVIAMSGPYSSTNDASTALAAVRDAIDEAVSNRLRETLGGTYSVSTASSIDLLPPARYVLMVDFEASPERMDFLATQVIAELQRLATQGPSALEFEAIRAAGIRDFDGRIRRNDYWVSELASHARLGWPFATIAQHPTQRADMTHADLRAVLASFIRTDSYVRVTMRPFQSSH